ncbi:hypothetical protein [Krasilnikoviella flava]|uniref:SipW-cognate class signal peptide n=1 Tax=Krasilnikoviella flava TaxID=526729 RepID=A0A1T5LK68_9MICO|nr:hypothetical protein [Krasilnikoviella flava]SKC76274.1 hypothetical protein SAMN04324258_3566 [Krasilnikoviella flava]
MTRGGRRPLRRACALAATVTGVVASVAGTSSCADLSAGYQGPAALDPPLAGPCWPLPDAVTVDVGYQVMQQYVVGDRWVLVAQWDRLSPDDFTASLTESLVDGGFTPRGAEDGWHRFEAPGYGAVAFDVTALEDATPETLVQGTFRLDLPRDAARPRTTAGCTPIQKVDPPAEGATVMGEAS